MSLLMQALKKAEHAKQQQEQAEGDLQHDKPFRTELSESLSLTPMEPAMAAERQSADSLSSPVADAVDLQPGAGETAQAEMPAAPPPFSVLHEPAPIKMAAETPIEPPPPPAGPETPPQPAAETQIKLEASSPKTLPIVEPKIDHKNHAAQQTARAVFASKQPAHRNRTLQIAIIGMLALLVSGIGFGYFYLQSLSQNSGVLPASVPPSIASPATVSAPSAQQPAAEQASAPPNSSASTTKQTIEPTMQVPPQELARAEAGPPKPAPATEQVVNKAATPKPAAQTTPKNAPSIQIRQTTVDNQVNPTLAAAYQAFMAGDTSSAQRQYLQVLQHDGNNRDALLGLAAIAVLNKQPAQASSYYVKLLELDPTDPDAIAALTSLQNGTLEQHESRLKKILTQHPQTASLHFVLGNLYAQTSRWAEAQQSYFQAYGAAPNNADYAFNLAVSLDRLSQSKLALEYYQRALALAQSVPGNFSKTSAQARVRELQASLEN